MIPTSPPGPERKISEEVLRCLEPLHELSSLRLRELSELCLTEVIDRGLDPFRVSGMRGKTVYLLTGELKLVFADGSSYVLVGGSETARLPIGKRPPPVVSARAITGIELLRLEDDVIDIMMTWDQLSTGARANSAVEQAPDWSLMSGAFRVQNLTEGALSRLPAASIDSLFERFERRRVKNGEVIVREGDEGDYYYIIESGRCQVVRKVGGADIPLAELKPGDGFGEEALVAEVTRNATVSVKSPGVLLRLKKDDFVELLREPLLKRLSWEEAEQQIAQGALWLDVRYSAEYRHGRLPGALNIPLGEIRNAFGLLDRDKEYVAYCQSGRRSSAAAFLLSQRGYRVSCLQNGPKPEMLAFT